MSFRDDIAINWEVSPRIIEITSASDEITVQELYDTLRTLAAYSEALDDEEIVDAGGKEGGIVAVTMTLFSAQVKFKDTGTPRVCKISGGNLFAVDGGGNDMSPIAYSANVTVAYAQSTSATAIELGEVAQEESVQHLIYVIGEPTSPSISDDLDEIEAKTGNLPADPADQSALVAHISKETADLLNEMKKLLEVKPPQGVGRRYWR